MGPLDHPIDPVLSTRLYSSFDGLDDFFARWQEWFDAQKLCSRLRGHLSMSFYPIVANHDSGTSSRLSSVLLTGETASEFFFSRMKRFIFATGFECMFNLRRVQFSSMGGVPIVGCVFMSAGTLVDTGAKQLSNVRNSSVESRIVFLCVCLEEPKIIHDRVHTECRELFLGPAQSLPTRCLPRRRSRAKA
eukprot:scaffold13478_cov132-Cylindrotheca_fusiformis.AAC.18